MANGTNWFKNHDDAGGTGGSGWENFVPEGDLNSVELFPVDKLEKMPRQELVAHVVRLQKVCGNLEDDNRFLGWEFKEFQDSLLCFSRAARLAHQLNAAGLDAITALATDELPGYFNCGFAALYFFNEETRLFTPRSIVPPLAEQVDLHREMDADYFLVKLLCDHSAPFLVECNREKGTMIADSDGNEIKSIPPEWLAALGPQALVFPLAVKHGDDKSLLLLGGLVIGAAKAKLTSHDAEIAAVFGDLFSSSLYNALLVKKLNDLTVIDSLTHLYNRRHLITQIAGAITQSRRQGFDLSLLMIDIDNFKRFNDTYGHLCGDEILRQLARLLQKAVRVEVDIAARYGGEEFAVVMPYCNVEQAEKVAQRLRDLIRENRFVFERVALSVTCSIGVAGCLAADTIDSFIDRADMALYQAKRNGRDQVAVASSRPLRHSRRMTAPKPGGADA